MMNWPKIPLKLVMAALFGVLIAGFSFETAQAAPCGGNGQKACHPLKRGPVCKPGLGKFGKICRPCGKANQRACPKLTPGKPCAKGLVKIKGYCRRCGGNGQRPCPVTARGPVCKAGLGKFGSKCLPCGKTDQRICPVLAKGKPCADGLMKMDGYCRRCGGNGERACPVLARGTVCKPGLGKFGGRCLPCGRQGQRKCPAIEKGRQCEEWTTNRDGKCVPCGRENQGACRLTDKGKPCQEGLRRKLDGTCVPDKIELVRRAALEQFAEIGGEFIDIIPSTIARTRDDSVAGGIRAKSSDTADRLDGDRHLLCRSDNFQAYTWGVAGDAKAVLGLGGDAGFAYDIRPDVREYRNGENGRNRWKFYASGGFSLQAGAGASAGVSFGCWLAQNHSLSGKTHGVVFDVKQLAKIALNGSAAFADALNTESFKSTGFSVLVGFWFDPDGGIVGDFQGFTVTPVAGRDVDIMGITYVKGGTAQFRPGR